MSTPRDRDGRGHDRRAEGASRRTSRDTPARTSRTSPTAGSAAPRPRRPPTGAPWQPPGWDLPAGAHRATGPACSRGRRGPRTRGAGAPERSARPRRWSGRSATGRPRRRPGLGAPARLDDLRRQGTRGRRPARPARDRAGPPGQGGPAGRRAARPGGTLELVAFDIVYPLGRPLVPQYAVTAAPLLGDRAGAAAHPGPVLEARHRRARAGAQRRTTPSTPAGCCSRPRTPRVRRLVAGPRRPGPAARQRRRRRVLDGRRSRRGDPARRPPAAADRAPRPAAHRARGRARRPRTEPSGGGRRRPVAVGGLGGADDVADHAAEDDAVERRPPTSRACPASPRGWNSARCR